MTWTNLQEIEQKIVEKQYTDKEAFHYFLGTAILYTLSYFLFGEANENAYKLVVIPTLCITIFASVYSFKTYTKNGGVDFFKDYFALSWVIGWRIFTLALISIFIVIMLTSVFFHNYDFEPFRPEISPFWISFELVFHSLFYYLLYRSFKRVSLKKPFKTKG